MSLCVLLTAYLRPLPGRCPPQTGCTGTACIAAATAVAAMAASTTGIATNTSRITVCWLGCSLSFTRNPCVVAEAWDIYGCELDAPEPGDVLNHTTGSPTTHQEDFTAVNATIGFALMSSDPASCWNVR